MIQTPRQKTVGWLTRWASGLRFPTLLAVIGSLFALDLLVPDLIPFFDEIVLGLLTVLLATFRRRRDDPVTGVSEGATIEVEAIRDTDPTER